MAQTLLKQILVELFVVALFGLVLGTIGPFNTYAMPTAYRIAIWMVFLIAGYGLFRPAIGVGCWLSDLFAVPRWLATGLALTLAALPMTLLVEAMFAGFDLSAALRSSEFAETYLDVWLIGFLVNGLFQLLHRNGGAAEPTPPAPSTEAPAAMDSPEPEFHRRLAPGFGPVLALAGEDHYVRVIGMTREELVLVRMRDAVAELAGVEGMQVHRSWWVARGAVQSIRRDGRAMVLVLPAGREVPVARDKAAMLRQAGWLGG